MAITLPQKMTDQEREMHRELSEALENNNAALADVADQLHHLRQEQASYIREGQRLSRHLARLEREVEKRYSTPLWSSQEAAG